MAVVATHLLNPLTRDARGDNLTYCGRFRNNVYLVPRRDVATCRQCLRFAPRDPEPADAPR